MEEMGKQEGSKNNSNRRNNDTKVGLTLRIVVAVYVLYLAYDLIQGFGETSGNERIGIAIAIIIFLAGGGAILLFSVKKLIRKEYMDADENTGSEATENQDTENETTENEER